MKRREELDLIFKDIDENKKKLINPVLDNISFLEEQMAQLRKLPFIEVNPRNPTKQRATKASKLYKELSANHTNAIDKVYKIINGDELQESDPVTEWLNEREKI